MPYVTPTIQNVEPTSLPNPLGINSRFCYNYPVTLVIGKMKFGLDNIRDLSGQDVLCITRPHWSERIRKNVINFTIPLQNVNKSLGFSTTDDQYLFELVPNLFRSRWYLTDSRSEKYLVARGSAKYSVQFKNTAGDGRDTTLQARWQRSKCDGEITCNEIPVAYGRLCGKRLRNAEYHIEVAPNVDLSMVSRRSLPSLSQM